MQPSSDRWMDVTPSQCVWAQKAPFLGRERLPDIEPVQTNWR